MKKIVPGIVLISLLFVQCKKEANRQLLNAYFKFEVNGVPTVINDEILLKENTFDCIVYGDTALYVHATKVYNGAGFIVKLKDMQEGYYELNGSNRGFYDNPKDKKLYMTDNTHTGTLTLKRGTFQGKTLLPTMEASFQFEGIDTTTGKKFVLSKGQFLMEIKKK